MALSPDGDGSYNIGTGFLVEFDKQIYLVTVAHLATGQVSQTDEWEMWADEVHYAPKGQSEGVLSLFNVGTFGERRPRFKFLRAADTHSILLDMILVPLEPANPMTDASEIFHLPNDWAQSYFPGQAIEMVGCQPWPEVNVQSHSLGEPGMVHLVDPPQTKGYSGCPAVDADGLLVGMAFGTDGPNYTGRGQLVAAPLIGRTARSVDGVG